MRTVNTLRHVPWTCLWGRFGETTSSWPTLSRRFVFWTCARPGARKYLTRRQLRGLPLLGTHFQSAPGGSGAGAYDRLTARRRNSLKLSPRSARCAR
jgi:hypothetical protein